MTRALQLLPIPRSLELRGGSLARGDARAASAQSVLDPNSALPAQGYQLEIDAQGIRIHAPDQSGLRYGQGTLEQIRAQCVAELPALRIRDWPDFPVRGYMLDVSRDRVPTQTSLLALVDTLASLRINQLQLYTEHTFAYSKHAQVWRDASPLTPDEIRALDERCAGRGIELVPNQQSFGHMERWLRQPAYRALAECPEAERPSCLVPTHESVNFMRSLYAELLPCFRSQTLNIGCDETFELGQGRSRSACETQGRGRVYLDYLLRLLEGLHAEGRSVQFWGDIVREHPELTQELPRENLIALVWGYEAPQDPDALPSEVRTSLARFGVSPESLQGFVWRVRPFAEAGLPFYVCPGTSSWNSLLGRWPNARANLLDAARSGLAQGASGYLITDWGDNGHHQPPCISLPPLAYGAAVSWCVETNAELELESALAAFLTRDRDGALAHALLELGALYQALGLRALNGSPLALSLLTPRGGRLPAWGETNADELAALIRTLEREREALARAAPLAPDDEQVRSELLQAAALARQGAWRLGELVLGQSPPQEARRDLETCIEQQERVWRVRSRPGGLPDSLARLRRLLD